MRHDHHELHQHVLIDLDLEQHELEHQHEHVDLVHDDDGPVTEDMMRSIRLALALVLLAAGLAGAQTTTSTSSSTTTSTSLQVVPSFPDLGRATTGRGTVKVLANGQRCNGVPCETGPFPIMASAYPGPLLYVDCDGACVADVVCRLAGQKHDVSLAASGSLTDAGTKQALSFCPSAYFRITTCTSCTARAWLVNGD